MTVITARLWAKVKMRRRKVITALTSVEIILFILITRHEQTKINAPLLLSPAGWLKQTTVNLSPKGASRRSIVFK
jgi:hypothetical protein